jgi:N-acetylglucosamine transport system permease protein
MRSARRRRERALFIASFLAPACLLYGVFVIWPVLEAFAFSLYRWRGISAEREFVGLGNFRRLFADPVFGITLLHNLQLFVGAGAAIVVLSLLIAHALQGKSRLVRGLRSLYLFPQVISLVVVAVLWTFIYNPNFGILNAALRAVGLTRLGTTAWLGAPSAALGAVAVAFVWHALGFYVMLFAAGIRQIPTDVQEAATLDGAAGLERLRLVTLPLLWSVLRVALVYLAINTLNVFALVYLMTQGGPDRHTEVMLTYLYELAFKDSDFGLGTALAVANFAVVMAVSGILFGLLRRDPQEARS